MVVEDETSALDDQFSPNLRAVRTPSSEKDEAGHKYLCNRRMTGTAAPADFMRSLRPQVESGIQ